MSRLLLSPDEHRVINFLAGMSSHESLKSIPINFIVDNKIAYLFWKSWSEKESGLHGKGLDKIRKKYQKVSYLLEEVVALSELFRGNKINFMIFKTIRHPQCDIADIDIVIEKDKLDRVKSLLLRNGYTNIQPWGDRDRNFVKSDVNGVGVALDIHIEEEFANEHAFKIGDVLNDAIWVDGICVPSLENDLLISISHLVWHSIARSHHRGILLSDVLYLVTLLERCNSEVVLRKIEKTWFRTLFFHYIYLVNTIYKSLYGVDINSPLVKIADELHTNSKLLKFLSKAETKKIKLPYNSIIYRNFCFVYKLFYDIRYFNWKEVIRNISTGLFYPIISNFHFAISLLKRKRLLICFTGIDGTGKTTHATKIIERFKSMGIPSQYVWCNWDPKISLPFMAFIYLITGYRRKNYHKNRILRKIWNYIVIIDFLYIYLFKVKIPLLIGKNVICDRYIYDTIADLIYDRLYNERASKILLKLIPKPDLIFMLDVPEEISILRKDDTKDAVNIKEYDDVIDYLKIHRNMYLKIAKSLKIPIIDTTKDFRELHEKIYKQVLYAYKRVRLTK